MLTNIAGEGFSLRHYLPGRLPLTDCLPLNSCVPVKRGLCYPATLLAGLLLAVSCFAEEDAYDPANYAFANYIGSGIYSASGRQVMVLNMPFSYSPDKDREMPYTFRLPVSLGFYDYSFEDVSDGSVPEKADTLSFVPGIEWTIPITKHLDFIPYIDLGVGHNFTNSNSVWIYSAGVSSEYRCRWDLLGEQRKNFWVNRIFYAGYDGMNVDEQDGYASIQTGVDLRLPVRYRVGSREGFMSFYTLGQWNIKSMKFAYPNRQDVTIENSLELGFTLGVEQPYDLKLFDISRIGLGYRMASGLRIWRLTFNMPLY